MPKDNERSLKPPSDWFDRKYAEIKKANPDYSDEQIRGTVGKIWYANMSKHQRAEKRHAEGKEYGKAPVVKAFAGIKFDLFKSKNGKRYQSVGIEEIKRMPAVVVDFYEADKFKEREVCTAPMVLEHPERYDSQTFTMLLQKFAEDFPMWNPEHALKQIELMSGLTGELKKRIEADKKAAEERKAAMEKAGDKNEKPNTYDQKKEWFYGKSVMLLDWPDA